ncbi:MAG: glycosyltransferase family 2 protein [Solobacterium sp.]|nr:glycosyltransferase family 2 protein [Solobacterium sp.]MBQ6533513.1 glycosyltransferase family 2 protein [Solobacterium sp.]
MSLLSIVVPCYNEQETVKLYYDAVSKVLSTMDIDHEIIFINDGSKDNTLAELTALYEDHRGEIRIIDFSRNFGKEAAFLAGLRAAKGDYVTVMDADLQDPPEMLPKMFEVMEKNNNDVVGSRRVTRAGEPKIRSFFARNFYKIINRYIEVEIVDGARDFRLMKRPVVDAILSLKEYNRFSKGLFVWVGFKCEYLEYENIERVAGETKWSFWGLFRYALDGIIEFTNAPLHFAFWTGGGLTFTMFVVLLVLLIRALLGKAVAMTAVILSCVLFMGGLILLCVGILGEYLAKTYGEVKGRPNYIIKDFYE